MIVTKEIVGPLAIRRQEYLLSGVARYEWFWPKLSCARLARWVLLRQRVATVLCAMFLISATVANAQHRSNNNLNARKFAAGWWSPQTTGSTPQLMISMAGLTRFEASDPIRNSPAHPTNYRVAEPINGSISSLRHYESALFPTAAMPSLSEHPVSLPPTSFLSLLQTNYTNWETSLSDSRSLTDVNGVSVYPLIQISYADWHLPVTLYISSLRNNNAW